MSKEEIIKQKQQEHVRNEKWILSSASHPFIVRLFSTFQDHSNVYFLMEYVSGGELFSHIRRHVRLSNAVARFYTAEIILAVSVREKPNKNKASSTVSLLSLCFSICMIWMWYIAI
jgi:protein kinase A